MAFNFNVVEKVARQLRTEWQSEREKRGISSVRDFFGKKDRPQGTDRFLGQPLSNLPGWEAQRNIERFQKQNPGFQLTPEQRHQVETYGRLLDPATEVSFGYRDPLSPLTAARRFDTGVGQILGGTVAGQGLVDYPGQDIAAGFASEAFRPTSLAAMALPPVRSGGLAARVAANAAVQGGANVAQDVALGRTDPEQLALSAGLGGAVGGVIGAGPEAGQAIRQAAQSEPVQQIGRELASETGSMKLGPDAMFFRDEQGNPIQIGSQRKTFPGQQPPVQGVMEGRIQPPPYVGGKDIAGQAMEQLIAQRQRAAMRERLRAVPVQGIGELPASAPPGLGGVDLVGPALEQARRRYLRNIFGDMEPVQGISERAAKRPEFVSPTDPVADALILQQEQSISTFAQRARQAGADETVVNIIVKAYEQAKTFMTTARRYADSNPIVQLYAKLDAFVEGKVPDGVVNEVARARLVMENAIRTYVDEWLRNFGRIDNVIEENLPNLQFVGPDKFRSIAMQNVKHAVVTHPEWFRGKSNELLGMLREIDRFQWQFYEVVRAIDPNAAVPVDIPYLRTVWQMPESDLASAVTRHPFGRASSTKKRAFPDPFEAMLKPDWPYQLKEARVIDLLRESAHLSARQIGTVFERNLITRRFGTTSRKTARLNGMVPFKNPNYAGHFAPPEIVNFIDQLYEPPPAALTGADKNFLAPVKNIVFGVGDIGVFGQHVLHLLSTRGIATAAGAVNRMLEAAHLPYMSLYLDDDLPRALQLQLDGVPQGIVGAIGDPAKIPGAPLPVKNALSFLQQAQFSGVLQPLRNMTYEGNLIMDRLLGRDITNPKIRREAAENALAFSGGSLGALRHSRRAGETAGLGAPHITRSMGASIMQVAKLNTPLAWATLANIAFTAYGVATAFNYMSGYGKPPEFNPLKGDWGTITWGGEWKEVEGRKVYVGGKTMSLFPQRSLMRALGKSVIAASEADPTAILDAWRQFAFTRVNPGIQSPAALAGVGFTDEGYFRFGNLSGGERVKAALPLPITGQAAIAGEITDPETLGLSVLGAPVYPGDTEKEATEKVKREAREFARQRVESTGYYDVENKVFDRLKAQGLFPDDAESFEAYYDGLLTRVQERLIALGLPPETAPLIVEDMPEILAYREITAGIREGYRESNPGLVRDLIQSGDKRVAEKDIPALTR